MLFGAEATWQVIAAVLGALVTLASEHQTQAQNTQYGRWLFPAVSTLMTSEEDLRDIDRVEARNTGVNSVGKISPAAGSGSGRCEMSPEEFAKAYPPLLEWIQTTLAANAHAAQSVASHAFSRLPLYFSQNTLASTKVVLVDPLPVPLPASMGLTRFADFVRGDSDGITYIDTFF